MNITPPSPSNSSPSPRATPAPDIPHSLTVGDFLVEPLGFHDPRPAFSWKLPPSASTQSAYRLRVAAGSKVWDSGWRESDRSVFVPYEGEPLASRERVTWSVCVRDGNGRELGPSREAGFELGLLAVSDWQSDWIRPAAGTDPTTEPVSWLRRDFDIAGKIQRARLYATARGAFEFTLNGQRVGNDYFTPGWTNYHQRIDTLTYDVTELLRPGSNTLVATLGTGWYAGRLPFGIKQRGPHGLNPELLAQLEIFHYDGSSQVIGTDEHWQATFRGPILSSSIYDGEHYDARRQHADWGPVAVTPNGGNARLTPKPFPAVRVTECLRPVRMGTPAPGRFVFDFGQNMVGWVRIKVPAEKNRTITIRFAEMLNADGTLYTENYRAALSTDSHTPARTGTVEWEPKFTFHGFQFVELSGLPEGVEPEPDWVTGVVLHSDLRRTGDFQSSHEKLNQLQSNIVWGWRGNSLEIPTDCPQRDERLGWTGDAQVFAPTAMFNFDCLAFWKSWLEGMRGEQLADGVIPDVIPSVNEELINRSPGWMDAATFIPWDVHVRTGDLTILEDNFEMMERLVGWYRSQSPEGLPSNIGGFGDWLQPHAQARETPGDWLGAFRGDTPRPFLGAAFYARSARILAQASLALGRQTEARRYAKESETVRAAFVREFFDEQGGLRNTLETQTAYALAIAFDLLPEEWVMKAGAHLARLVEEADGHLRTGFLGTPHLLSALDATGHADLACGLLFRETYPSWFYPINQGATTMWERWNSYSHESGFGDRRMNSFNHYAYGAVGQWLYERIAGLTPDPAHPGYKHFRVRPLFPKQLQYAAARLETPYGPAASRWQRSNDEIALTIEVPPNTSATVDTPALDGLKPLCPGGHAFTFKTPLA